MAGATTLAPAAAGSSAAGASAAGASATTAGAGLFFGLSTAALFFIGAVVVVLAVLIGAGVHSTFSKFAKLQRREEDDTAGMFTYVAGGIFSEGKRVELTMKGHIVDALVNLDKLQTKKELLITDLWNAEHFNFRIREWTPEYQTIIKEAELINGRELDALGSNAEGRKRHYNFLFCEIEFLTKAEQVEYFKRASFIYRNSEDQDDPMHTFFAPDFHSCLAAGALVQSVLRNIEPSHSMYNQYIGQHFRGSQEKMFFQQLATLETGLRNNNDKTQCVDKHHKFMKDVARAYIDSFGTNEKNRGWWSIFELAEMGLSYESVTRFDFKSLPKYKTIFEETDDGSLKNLLNSERVRKLLGPRANKVEDLSQLLDETGNEFQNRDGQHDQSTTFPVFVRALDRIKKVLDTHLASKNVLSNLQRNMRNKMIVQDK